MIKINKKYFFTTSIIIFLFIGKISEAQNNLIVISNLKGAPDEMKMTDLVSIMKAQKQRWTDGTKISIALMKSSTPAGQSISKKVYSMSGDEMNKFWLALVFQGKASAPVFFTSKSDLEDFVTVTSGAIGIIEVPSESKLRTVIIDGKKIF